MQSRRGGKDPDMSHNHFRTIVQKGMVKLAMEGNPPAEAFNSAVAGKIGKAARFDNGHNKMGPGII